MTALPIAVSAAGRTLNVDQIRLSAIDTVQSGTAGTVSGIQTADVLTAAPTQADGDVAEDGINTNVTTVWIIISSVVFSAAVIAVTVYLAKKNKKAK